MQSADTKPKTFKPISISLDEVTRKRVAARMGKLGLVSRSEYVRRLIREDIQSAVKEKLKK